MKLSGPFITMERARNLRQNMTKPERLLWWALRRNQAGFKFRRQHPAGRYVLDFYCDAAKLCVEVDGPAHDVRQRQDRRRDEWLASEGVTIMRIPADEVTRNLDGVVRHIIAEIGRNVQSPSGASRHLPPRGRSC